MHFLVQLDLFLLLLIPFARAQDCFCPRGASVPDPGKVVQLSSTANTTCRQLEEDASKGYLVRAYGCNYFRYYAHLCGCERKDEEDVCRMCKDDLALSVEVERSTATSRCDEYAIQAKYDPFQMGCGYYNYLGEECGCIKNRPPFEGCSLCADGSKIPFASEQVRLGIPGLEQGTCQQVGDYVRYVQEPGSEACIRSQATLGSYCGCKKEPQPEGACPLCTEEGMIASNKVAPTFNYLSFNGQTQMYQSGMSCLEAELIAHEMALSELGDNTCSSLREQLSAVCCQADPRLVSLAAESSSAVTAELPKVATLVSVLLGLMLLP